MTTFIQHPIGPSFQSEITAAGLSGQPFSWTAKIVTADVTLPADKLAALRAVVAAHDPTKPDPNPSRPEPACSKLGLKRAFEERGLWTTVRAMIASSANMQEDWDLAIELRPSDPVVKAAVLGLAQLGIALSDADVLAIVNRANQLVA